jgi:hypothetical protein
MNPPKHPRKATYRLWGIQGIRLADNVLIAMASDKVHRRPVALTLDEMIFISTVVDGELAAHLKIYRQLPWGQHEEHIQMLKDLQTKMMRI